MFASIEQTEGSSSNVDQMGGVLCSSRSTVVINGEHSGRPYIEKNTGVAPPLAGVTNNARNIKRSSQNKFTVVPESGISMDRNNTPKSMKN